MSGIEDLNQNKDLSKYLCSKDAAENAAIKSETTDKPSKSFSLFDGLGQLPEFELSDNNNTGSIFSAKKSPDVQEAYTDLDEPINGDTFEVQIFETGIMPLKFQRYRHVRVLDGVTRITTNYSSRKAYPAQSLRIINQEGLEEIIEDKRFKRSGETVRINKNPDGSGNTAIQKIAGEDVVVWKYNAKTDEYSSPLIDELFDLEEELIKILGEKQEKDMKPEDELAVLRERLNRLNKNTSRIKLLLEEKFVQAIKNPENTDILHNIIQTTPNVTDKFSILEMYVGKNGNVLRDIFKIINENLTDKAALEDLSGEDYRKLKYHDKHFHMIRQSKDLANTVQRIRHSAPQDKNLKTEVNGAIDSPTSQGNTGNCWMIAVLNSLANNPKGQKILKESIEKVRDDIYKVTLKGAEPAFTATITRNELNANTQLSTGDADARLFEIAFQKYAVTRGVNSGEEEKLSSEIDGIGNIDAMVRSDKHEGVPFYDIGNGGHESVAAQLLTGKASEAIAFTDNVQNKIFMIKMIKAFDNNQIMQVAAQSDYNSNLEITAKSNTGETKKLHKKHAYSVVGVDKNANNGEGEVTIINPWNSEERLTLKIEEAVKFFNNITVTNL